MKYTPVQIQEMVRRALLAQREISSDELLLGEPVGELLPLTLPVADDSSQVRKISTGDAIGGGIVNSMTSRTDIKSYKTTAQHFEAICECQQCPLGKTRNKFVYGVGNPNADLMLIGEAPGAEEDRLGEPFVGRAGQLLDKILLAIGFTRENVYIANILKCRPPGNRDPEPSEMEQCFPYLKEQIKIVKPKLLCALGRISAQALLDTKTPLGKLRGNWHKYEDVPLLVTYHPAALLRFPKYKKDTWDDVQLLKAEFEKLT